MREVKVILDSRNRELRYVYMEENVHFEIDKLKKQGKPVRVITKTIK